MSFVVKDNEYINQKEALELLGIRHPSLKQITRKHGLKTYEFPTKPGQIFYLKKALEDLRDTPIEIQPK